MTRTASVTITPVETSLQPENHIPNDSSVGTGTASDDEEAEEAGEEQPPPGTVQCQLCGNQLTLPALHAHLEQSHAMRLNETTGELEDLVERGPPAMLHVNGGISDKNLVWQAHHSLRQQQFEPPRQHFLLAGSGLGHEEDEGFGAAAIAGSAMQNGWHLAEEGEAAGAENRAAAADPADHNHIAEGSAASIEEEANVEYSDDPDAMCQQVCEMCGAEALVLRNHTRSAHGLNIAQYRELYPAFKFSSQVHHR